MKKLGKTLVLGLAVCLVVGGVSVRGAGGNTAKPEWGYIAPTTI